MLALADALSDAMGMHVSEEAEGVHSPREIWEATLSTLLSKAGTTLSFLPIVLALEMEGHSGQRGLGIAAGSGASAPHCRIAGEEGARSSARAPRIDGAGGGSRPPARRRGEGAASGRLSAGGGPER